MDTDESDTESKKLTEIYNELRAAAPLRACVQTRVEDTCVRGRRHAGSGTTTDTLGVCMSLVQEVPGKSFGSEL